MENNRWKTAGGEGRFQKRIEKAENKAKEGGGKYNNIVFYLNLSS